MPKMSSTVSSISITKKSPDFVRLINESKKSFNGLTFSTLAESFSKELKYVTKLNPIGRIKIAAALSPYPVPWPLL